MVLRSYARYLARARCAFVIVVLSSTSVDIHIALVIWALSAVISMILATGDGVPDMLAPIQRSKRVINAVPKMGHPCISVVAGASC